jgi:hypothetical protein
LSEVRPILTGHKSLIVGVANDQSIAYGCAEAFRASGAELAITWLNEKARPHVEPLGERLGAAIMGPLNVENPGELEAMFDQIRERGGKLDSLVHSIAFAPKEDLQGGLLDCSAEPGLAPARREHEALRRFFGLLVEDVLATSAARLAAHAPADAAAVRHLGVPVVGFAGATFAELKEIRAFLHQRMYRHWTVQRMRRKARAVVRELFAMFVEAPELMPPDWNACADLDEEARARVVADYIAGMTDRFALQEHRKLTDPQTRA